MNEVLKEHVDTALLKAMRDNLEDDHTEIKKGIYRDFWIYLTQAQEEAKKTDGSD